jgi:insulysin
MRLAFSASVLLACLSASSGFASLSPGARNFMSPLTAATLEPETTTCSPGTGTVIIDDDADFIKPEPDQRKYRAIRLANGLKCLLVSSPESDVEAAAVHVQAGHMDDPANRPGLAHFHEHMLFLGTKRYPDENEYEAFLNQNGGSSNAYTDMEDTNYFFSVTPNEDDEEEEDDDDDETETTSNALSGGLDRLAQFFIAPLFDSSMVDRELRAIDSEYRNSFTSDSWRNYQLLKFSACQDHPFSKFGCGNYNTLTQGGKIVNATHSEDIGSLPVNDLLQFWKTHYQTYNLRLSVVGQSDLDALQKTVEETFGALPASEGTPRRQKLKETNEVYKKEYAQYGAPPAFGPEQLQKIRNVVPLVEARAIKLYFATPPLDDPLLKQSRPYRVLSHLLGHESPGSLHALLNDEGLLTDLSSGIGIDTSDFSLFSVTLSLTKKGMEQKDRVLNLIFQWIALLRDGLADETLMKAYHDELNQISDMNFRYRENGDPTDFCSRAAELMFLNKPSQILVGEDAGGDYDPVVAKAFLERMTPENAMITVISPEFDDVKESEWQTEKWYGAKYHVVDFMEDQVKEWTHPPQIDERLQLPALNEYIPTDFSLRCDQENGASPVENSVEDDDDEVVPPEIILERPGIKMWHKMDFKWRVPKTFIRLSLQTPNVYRSPRTMTLNRMYERILNDDLNSFIYDARMAGSNYRVSSVPSGIRISLQGYSEKLPFLMDTVTTRMLSLIEELKEGPENNPSLALKFKKAHDNLLRETKNYKLDSPYEIANYNSRLVSEESVWNMENYIAEMEGENAEKDPLTMEECGRVAEECLRGRLKAEALCYGNINKEEALAIVEVVDEHFLKPSRPLLQVEVPVFRAMKLPTVGEAERIFGADLSSQIAPLVYQEVAHSESEENNALELSLQAGCDHDLGYEGVAVLDMISHLAYNSAFNQLRTKEQLGYIVSAFVRKVAGGAWSLAVIVQSSVAVPSLLEERSQAWLTLFRQELEELSLEELEKEAGAVVAQLMERDTTLSQEVSTMWGEIVNAASLPHSKGIPAFDRVERIAQELVVSASCSPEEETPEKKSAAVLKQKMLAFFDKYFAVDAPERRVLSARVYNHKSKAEFEANRGKPGVLSSYEEIRHLKQFLSTHPVAPYFAQKF